MTELEVRDIVKRKSPAGCSLFVLVVLLFVAVVSMHLNDDCNLVQRLGRLEERIGIAHTKEQDAFDRWICGGFNSLPPFGGRRPATPVVITRLGTEK